MERKIHVPTKAERLAAHERVAQARRVNDKRRELAERREIGMAEALDVYDRCQALQDGTIEGAIAAREALAEQHRRLHR